jgi:hypothetical protein
MFYDFPTRYGQSLLIITIALLLVLLILLPIPPLVFLGIVNTLNYSR